MGASEAEAAVRSAFETAELVEIWFWDGDLGHALGSVAGEESSWFLERGTLIEEDDQLHGIDNLIEGDVVYRARKVQALDGAADPRERNFDWQLVDPFTGEIQATAIKIDPIIPEEDDWG